MAAAVRSSGGVVSLAMERTGQWVLSQEIPTDVIVEVGDAYFSLHKFMLVPKSNLVRKLILESNEADLAWINLSDIPGGPETFEKTAKFCYGVNFEITVHNVAALLCAAEYLQMTDNYCDSNLAGRAEDFLSRVALTSLSGAVVVLKSCENLFPMADDLNIVQRCLDMASAKACVEANFPSRSPPNWWAEELTILDINSFGKIIRSMKSRGAKGLTLASAIITYTERWLPDLVQDRAGNSSKSSDSDAKSQQQEILESIVALMPSDKSAFPVNFLCYLTKTAVFLRASSDCKNELEKRISTIFEHATVDDLLVLSFTFDGERLLDLDTVRKIISGFVEKEKSVAVFSAGEFKEACSPATQRVAKTVDAYLGEIATYGELSISKFNGIANLVSKPARKVDDDLYRAIDIYLKAHPQLDEIEREKACSVMDPLKLSYEARVHASKNKRLPVQIVLHVLYHDQLSSRSGINGKNTADAQTTRNQQQADVYLAKENEALRTELLKMQMFISDMQKTQGETTPKGSAKKATFFSSMSRTLGKMNPFRTGSKDTSNIDHDTAGFTAKPRRRRFSIS